MSAESSKISSPQHRHASATDRNQTKNGSRPVSFYDNCMENGNNVLHDDSVRETRFDGSPTQAHCLMTTVPQNIAAQNIANKHTPTRNSLRHSRMIAMNKNGRGFKCHFKYTSSSDIFHCFRFRRYSSGVTVHHDMLRFKSTG
ncbi:uncharacterized protein BDFB_000960 [Asbolus verrucosus]|uniref:Uncharacterized protein n=1 Tax=Asbolus verrucosus TaxID=1661398 RepID=A0A482VEU6_ASBVE|nr:uncharacterized protein BDFB_000960 [Asbolus verrucosus]